MNKFAQVRDGSAQITSLIFPSPRRRGEGARRADEGLLNALFDVADHSGGLRACN